MGRYGASRHRRFDLVGVVRGFGADVIVVPECWRQRDGRGALDPLADDGYRIETIPFTTMRLAPGRPRREVPGDGTWELALLSRLPVLARRDVPIGRVPRDAAGPRRAIVGTVDVGGTPVEVYAVHTSSKLWFAGPGLHLLGLRPHLPTDDRPAVIAGDCNLWGPGVVGLLPRWRRAVLGKTFPAHAPAHQIDHILVNGRVGVVAGEVLPETPSDHRPIRATLRVGPSGSVMP